jgi:DNA-binding NarL/FixJ family response regulator
MSPSVHPPRTSDLGLRTDALRSDQDREWWCMAISLVLVEHPPAVRRTLQARLSLENDFRIVGEASDAACAIELAVSLGPDVVLLDAEMPHLDLSATVGELAERAPTVAVVVLTLEPARARRALRSATVVGKHEGTGALLAAIRSAGTGQPPD